MDTKYVVSRGGAQMGPYALDEIIIKLGSGELVLTDFIFDQDKKDWTPILQFVPVQTALQQNKPQAPPTLENMTAAAPPRKHKTSVPTSTPGASGGDWYIMKGDKQYGPFTYPEMIKMLQEKEAYGFDCIWRAGQEDWKYLAEVPEFQIGQVQKWMEEDSAYKKVMQERSGPRREFSGSVIVHNNNEVWKGAGIEISEGGAGITIPNSLLLPGQTIQLHFQKTEKLPAFNVTVEVVNKRFTKNIKTKDVPTNYDVRFLDIEDTAKKAVKGYVRSA